MATAKTTAIPVVGSTNVRRLLAVLAGATLVAASAQLAIPVPGTPVPQTFQAPAILLVGGLLGAQLGAASMVTYLVAGAIGLPVFAPIGLPGIARLFGPTGGYLLAAPLAAALVGALVGTRTAVRIGLALVVGLIVIHAAGVAQLLAMGGDLTTAVQYGSLPFLATDTVKLLLVGLLIGKVGNRLGALL